MKNENEIELILSKIKLLKVFSSDKHFECEYCSRKFKKLISVYRHLDDRHYEEIKKGGDDKLKYMRGS